jgi:hypothetical protein
MKPGNHIAARRMRHYASPGAVNGANQQKRRKDFRCILEDKGQRMSKNEPFSG